jgi:aspartate racemase
LKNKLGILGLGSYSTLFYVKTTNKKYQDIHGGDSTCPFTLLNTDFQRINPFLPDQFETLIERLVPYLSKLESYGISHLLVPNITLHETLDKLIDHYTFELIHPLKLLVEQLNRESISEVVILGTRYTMQGDYISAFLVNQGIQTKSLQEEDMEIIDQLRTEVYEGKETTPKTRDTFIKLLKEHTIVLACTELSVFATSQSLNCSYDMASLQIDKVLKLLLENSMKESE